MSVAVSMVHPSERGQAVARDRAWPESRSVVA
jgi:hypothetical protein